MAGYVEGLEKRGSETPQIHIWAPAKSEQPAIYARMKIFADNREWLTELFKAHGIQRADIMPPLPQGSYDPARDAPEIKYEIFPSPDISQEAISVIRRAIYGKLRLMGAVFNPFESHEDLQTYASGHKLGAIGPDIPPHDMTGSGRNL